MKTTYSAPLEHTYLDSEIHDKHHNLILKNILSLYELEPNDRVLEIGSGTGRYTKFLIDCGFYVVAVEPDPVLAEKLIQRLKKSQNFELCIQSAESVKIDRKGIRLVCGFHVLHHLDKSILKIFGAKLRAMESKSKDFAGWFFLEPNPWCPFYPIQILLTPGMRFYEEKGIWINKYNEYLGKKKQKVIMGTIGLFPPRDFLKYVPFQLQQLSTTLSSRSSIHRLYMIYGVRCKIKN